MPSRVLYVCLAADLEESRVRRLACTERSDVHVSEGLLPGALLAEGLVFFLVHTEEPLFKRLDDILAEARRRLLGCRDLKLVQLDDGVMLRRCANGNAD